MAAGKTVLLMVVLLKFFWGFSIQAIAEKSIFWSDFTRGIMSWILGSQILAELLTTAISFSKIALEA
jgi:hypothetical protein